MLNFGALQLQKLFEKAETGPKSLEKPVSRHSISLQPMYLMR
jgi:hypothetical protein